jgi:hypothetical protein
VPAAEGAPGEAGGEQAAGPSAASPKAVALQGLAVLLLAMGASLGLRLGENRGPLTAWTAFAGGVAAVGPGYTIIRYFDFLSDQAWRGLASRDPGAVEALAVAALVVAGAVWLFLRTRAARGRGGAGSSAGGGLTGQALENAVEAALGRAIAATGSRIGFVGRFAPGKGRRDLRLLAMRDGTAGGGGGGGKRLTPEQLGVLLDHQKIETRPIIAEGPRDEAIQRWLPKPLPEVKALLGVPIVERDEPVGLLGLSNSPHGYDDVAVAKVKPMVDELRQLLADSGAGAQSGSDETDAGAEDDEDAAPADEGEPGRSAKKKKAKKKKRRSSRRKGILRGTSPWRVASGRRS